MDFTEVRIIVIFLEIGVIYWLVWMIMHPLYVSEDKTKKHIKSPPKEE